MISVNDYLYENFREVSNYTAKNGELAVDVIDSDLEVCNLGINYMGHMLKAGYA